MRRAARALLAAAIVSLARPAGAAAPYAPPPPAPAALPPAARAVDIDEHLGRRIRADLDFIDMDGRPVRLADYLDGQRPLVLSLAYYRCPMLCGLVLRGLADGLAAQGLSLGDQYRALTVSFDPRDTPEAAADRRRTVLAALGPSAPAGAWPFLVGREAESSALADDLGFRYAYDERTDQYAHPAAVFVLTPDGRISRYLYGAAPAPLDLRLALIEAGGGRIGTIADRVIVTCYRYDPATRRYAPFLRGFFRIGGALILATVAALLGALFVRERRARHEERAGQDRAARGGGR